ncbi:carbon-phosphorus lyase complex subunit PhnI [Flavobacteriaceae bacterium MHTCC 0001]
MGYVAVKGGTEAIENAKHLVEFYRLREETSPIDVAQIKSQFRLAIDKIMGEGSFYAPEYGALALKQVEGDILEAAFVMRAYRATLSRNYYSEPINTENMFIERRISSSFRDIPGGQILGPTRDYTQRMLQVDLATEDDEDMKKFLEEFKKDVDTADKEEITTFGKVIDLLRGQGLLKGVGNNEDTSVMDVTRVAVKYPAPRSARLQMLARAETGGIMALGYSSMRGHGSVHPTVGELRVGLVKVNIKDHSGRQRYIGKIRVTEAEMISKAATKSGNAKVPYYSIGYGLCFGQNETKAICMGILDRAMRIPGNNAPANDQEFVLYHTEGVESLGFTNHLKLPHYVTFQSGLSNLRKAVKRKEENKNEEQSAKTGSVLEQVNDDLI